MIIRESISSELDAIRILHMDAFGKPEGEVVAQLACNILDDESAKPLLSLVVPEKEIITGHIIFSSLKIEGNQGVAAFILAPLAVSRSRQNQGLGSQLIQKGLRELKIRGAEVVFVYGDPNYYRRFGFETGHRVEAPFELEYPDAWMAQELKTNVLPKLQGVAKCCTSLMSRKYW